MHEPLVSMLFPRTWRKYHLKKVMQLVRGEYEGG